ncbi:hypothetical protein F511_37728 [Dorcoceras hygrometricum]|uniref:CCHC-type domain-containing protein n=1 Tax=Dorcoceras hygrometricum TaxID=472368 RepID=A0A2Z7D397_9LAMI|nr:hypothetical protein F511_37728 [Dorcoceras hygrometricum]
MTGRVGLARALFRVGKFSLFVRISPSCFQLRAGRYISVSTGKSNLSSLYTMHSKSAGGNHWSVIFRVRQTITSRWSSDTKNQSITTPMIALDFSGTKNQSAGHNVALKQIAGMSGRGRGRRGERRGSTTEEVSSGGPACVIVVITPPVEQLVRQSSQGSGHSSGQGPSHWNSQKGFRDKQKRQASQFKKQKSPKRPKTDQKESLEQQPQPSNLAPRMNIKPTCPTCNKKHVGQCIVGQDGCYRCGIQGHNARKCPKLKRPIDSIKRVVEADQETPATAKVSGKIRMFSMLSSTLIISIISVHSLIPELFQFSLRLAYFLELIVSTAEFPVTISCCICSPSAVAIVHHQLLHLFTISCCNCSPSAVAFVCIQLIVKISLTSVLRQQYYRLATSEFPNSSNM